MCISLGSSQPRGDRVDRDSCPLTHDPSIPSSATDASNALQPSSNPSRTSPTAPTTNGSMRIFSGVPIGATTSEAMPMLLLRANAKPSWPWRKARSSSHAPRSSWSRASSQSRVSQSCSGQCARWQSGQALSIVHLCGQRLWRTSAGSERFPVRYWARSSAGLRAPTYRR